jgi:hypothetical protein
VRRRRDRRLEPVGQDADLGAELGLGGVGFVEPLTELAETGPEAFQLTRLVTAALEQSHGSVSP